MQEYTVTISKAEYEDLLLFNERYELLLEALYEHAHLSWNKTYLDFSCEKVSDLLKLIDGCDYRAKFKELERRK